ncbi:MAG: S1C family serine protease [Chloroflexota bacterium]
MQRLSLAFRFVLLLLLVVLPACSGQDTSLRQQVDAQATEIAQLKATATPSTTPSPVPTATATVAATPTRSIAVMLREVAPAVVRIRSGDSEGTGFVVFSAGEVLTAYHVIGDASARPTVVTHDGLEYRGVVVGASETLDMALLAVPALSAGPLTLAGDVSVGDAVIAVGYAAGLPGEPSITRGIVSGKRQITDPPLTLIQTDAPINPGNSGGPLLSEAGEVVGLNVVKLRGSQAEYENMGFAVGVETIMGASTSLRSGMVKIVPTPTVEPEPTAVGPASPPVVVQPLPPTTTPSNPGSLLVRVLHSDGEPGPGCVVRTQGGKVARTGPSGTATIGDLTTGAVEFRLSCPFEIGGNGYEEYTANVIAGQITEKTIRGEIPYVKMIEPQPLAHLRSPPLVKWNPIPGADHYDVLVHRFLPENTGNPLLETWYPQWVMQVTTRDTQYQIPAGIMVSGNEYRILVMSERPRYWGGLLVYFD